eukprot:TRINITY_DN3447_c0_g1_i2.p1 TRINITY_DN3447_c0_g1~~TRINITY_DN3447_c0_g1_i2.p1  ORF type:complete len:438 (-),score=132.06 TRINITY_DN3447_c0_g1_i2:32-1315(-)
MGSRLLALTLIVALASLAAAEDADVGYFWQITDVHLQPQYYEKASVREHCVAGDGDAGLYGTMDGACDLPQITADSAFQLMKLEKPEPDFIFYTGDMLPHDPLEYDEDDVIRYQANVTFYLEKYFPRVKAYPLLGNHDTLPRFQMYDYEYWLYDRTADTWSEYLSTDMQATFRKGGYYTTLITTGLRVIALNTAVLYYHNNFVNPANDSDPAGMFAWAKQVLDTAVANDEKVMMIYHIPVGFMSGVQCQFHEQYNDDFIKLLSPYHSIILGHINGHDHLDFYRLIGDQTPAGTSVSFTAGALTEYDVEKPRLRLFKYKRTAPFTVLDYTSWALDLHESNLIRTALWKKEYVASEDYAVSDLSSASMIGLLDTMWTNDTIFGNYISHWKGVEWVGKFCTPFKLCKRDVLCNVKYQTRVPLYDCLLQGY